MIFDLHSDTLYKLYEKKRAGESVSLLKSDLAIDEGKLSRGGYLGQCFAVWTGKEKENPYKAALDMIDIFHSEIKKSKRLAPVYSFSDVIRNKEERKISALLSLEDAAPIGRDIGKLYELYRLGVRMIGLTWNYPNEVGYPSVNKNIFKNKFDFLSPKRKDGLTDFGRELVREMNKLGVIVDVSHLSDAGFYEVAKISKKPFVASHSNARGLCPHPRNLDDKMLKKLADCGGVVGINYYYEFLEGDRSRGLKTVSRAIEHIRYIGRLIGYEHIALGSDFDGIERGGELDTSEDLPKLIRALSKNGFPDSVIEKITYRNALRVFREAWS